MAKPLCTLFEMVSRGGTPKPISAKFLPKPKIYSMMLHLAHSHQIRCAYSYFPQEKPIWTAWLNDLFFKCHPEVKLYIFCPPGCTARRTSLCFSPSLTSWDLTNNATPMGYKWGFKYWVLFILSSRSRWKGRFRWCFCFLLFSLLIQRLQLPQSDLEVWLELVCMGDKFVIWEFPRSFTKFPKVNSRAQNLRSTPIWLFSEVKVCYFPFFSPFKLRQVSSHGKLVHTGLEKKEQLVLLKFSPV